ncbi:unnamed protein product, partial [Discosporangium mesarthrocarpum]
GRGRQLGDFAVSTWAGGEPGSGEFCQARGWAWAPAWGWAWGWASPHTFNRLPGPGRRGWAGRAESACPPPCSGHCSCHSGHICEPCPPLTHTDSTTA